MQFFQAQENKLSNIFYDTLQIKNTKINVHLGQQNKNINDLTVAHHQFIKVSNSGIVKYLEIIINEKEIKAKAFGRTNIIELSAFWQEIMTNKNNIQKIQQTILKYCQLISYSDSLIEFIIKDFDGKIYLEISQLKIKKISVFDNKFSKIKPSLIIEITS